MRQNCLNIYRKGPGGMEGGVEKDMKKCIYHAEQAAIGGHDLARFNLGVREKETGNMNRAVKHWIIAANIGCDSSIEALKKYYAQGVVSKEDFGAALRAHHAAVKAMKSPQRDEADAFTKRRMAVHAAKQFSTHM